MASQNAIATKTVNAVRTIQTASTALAEKLDIEITPLPNITKYDADYGRAVQLSHLADVLKKIAVATGAAKEGDFNVSPAESPVDTKDEAAEPETSAAPKRKKK